MPTIRVDDDVWSWLKSQAQPFEDTPNTVLRRVAGLDAGRAAASQGSPGLRQMAPRTGGKKTPQNEFRRPLLQILLKHRGSADRTTVLRELEAVMADRLTPFDRQAIKSGTIRWQKSAEWEVSTMRQEGLIVSQSESPRGIWRLSTAGERAARSS